MSDSVLERINTDQESGWGGELFTGQKETTGGESQCFVASQRCPLQAEALSASTDLCIHSTRGFWMPDGAQLSQRGPTLARKWGPQLRNGFSAVSRKDRANSTQLPQPALHKPSALGMLKENLSQLWQELCGLWVHPDDGYSWTGFAEA